MKLQRGHAITEYIVVTGVMALVLFVPHELTNNMAPVDYLARSIATFFRGFSFLISVF
ncbi:hypothetical protein ACO0KY_15515 [Undibacterium sp. Dicai25W]|uniref:hypothetical protein n=1 Tax=Undibacterium sp. Dicai25W TaxID=3413034 RepID=UPI003BEF874B